MKNSPISTKILEEVRNLPEGTPIRAKGLLHLGSRAAVDKALSRLAKSGELIRITRGVYAHPIEGRFGVRAPEPERVVEALAHELGEAIVEGGGAAAHALGLTQQVPLGSVYWTSGPGRTFRAGRRTVTVRHAESWKLVLPGRPAGAAVRALAWLRRDEVPQALKTLQRKLPQEEIRELLNARGVMPGWLASEVSKLA